MIIKIRTCYCFWLLARPFFSHISSEFPIFLQFIASLLLYVCASPLLCYILIRALLRLHMMPWHLISNHHSNHWLRLVRLRNQHLYRNRHYFWCVLLIRIFYLSTSLKSIDCSEKSYKRKSLNNQQNGAQHFFLSPFFFFFLSSCHFHSTPLVLYYSIRLP